VTTTAEQLAQSLADRLGELDAGCDPAVIAAFRRVPRHAFLPDVPLETAYLNDAVPVKIDGVRIASSSSEPAMMATMLDQLALRPGHRVLEIGTGSGYNAALMATLVGPQGRVTTVDIEQDLVDAAAGHLSSIGIDNVTPVGGDGALGHPGGAPYDRIIATVGLWDFPPALADQLAPGGRLVLPLSVRGSQLSIAFERADGHFRSVSVRQCGFMRLRGPNSGPERKMSVDPERGVRLLVTDEREVDAAAVRDLLDTTPLDVPTGISATLAEVHNGLDLWLTLSALAPVQLVATGLPEDVARGPVPCMYEWKNPPWRERITLAELLPADALVALARDPGGPLDMPDPTTFQLLARVFGDRSAGAEAAEALRARTVAWHEAGRPVVTDVTVRAYPASAQVRPGPGEFVVTKRHSALLLSWPAV
jgi:protein-L-isoaspartate(D-aspartate) O-methyltransferase